MKTQVGEFLANINSQLFSWRPSFTPAQSLDQKKKIPIKTRIVKNVSLPSLNNFCCYICFLPSLIEYFYYFCIFSISFVLSHSCCCCLVIYHMRTRHVDFVLWHLLDAFDYLSVVFLSYREFFLLSTPLLFLPTTWSSRLVVLILQTADIPSVTCKIQFKSNMWLNLL